jgi:hypothetical protein
MIARIDAVIDWGKSTMFALLRHIGHTSRYEIPPRPAALRAHRDTGCEGAIGYGRDGPTGAAHRSMALGPSLPQSDILALD